MTDNQENKFAMLQTVITFLTNFASVWEPVAAVGDIKSKITTLEADILALRQIQVLDTTGITVNKTEIRDQLTQATFLLANAVASYATINDNYELLGEVSYTLSDLKKSRDNIFYDIAVLIQSKARPLETELSAFLIKPEDITGHQTLIEQYMQVLPDKRVAVTAAKTSTTDLKLKFKEMDDLLKNKLDRLILLFKSENPSFVDQYFNARIIIDLGHRFEVNNSIISGNVTGYTDEIPIPAVHVWVIETGQSANTGPDGLFEFTLQKPGDYTLKAEKSGYKPYTSDTLKVEENHKITLDINLEPLT